MRAYAGQAHGCETGRSSRPSSTSAWGHRHAWVRKPSLDRDRPRTAAAASSAWAHRWRRPWSAWAVRTAWCDADPRQSESQARPAKARPSHSGRPGSRCYPATEAACRSGDGGGDGCWSPGCRTRGSRRPPRRPSTNRRRSNPRPSSRARTGSSRSSTPPTAAAARSSRPSCRSTGRRKRSRRGRCSTRRRPSRPAGRIRSDRGTCART